MSLVQLIVLFAQVVHYFYHFLGGGHHYLHHHLMIYYFVLNLIQNYDVQGGVQVLLTMGAVFNLRAKHAQDARLDISLLLVLVNNVLK